MPPSSSPPPIAAQPTQRLYRHVLDAEWREQIVVSAKIPAVKRRQDGDAGFVQGGRSSDQPPEQRARHEPERYVFRYIARVERSRPQGPVAALAQRARHL